MHYRSPIEVVELLKDEPEEWLFPHPFIFLHCAMLRRVCSHVSSLESEWLPISRDSADQICEYLKETLGLEVSSVIVLQWFSLYPFEAATFDEVDPFIEESHNSLMDIVSHYYLNSWWPAESDGIADETWIKLLERAQEYFKKANEARKPSMWSI